MRLRRVQRYKIQVLGKRTNIDLFEKYQKLYTIDNNQDNDSQMVKNQINKR